MENTGNDDPGQEVRQIRNGLHQLLAHHQPDLVEKDGKYDCHNKGCHQVQYTHGQRVADYLQEGCVGK